MIGTLLAQPQGLSARAGQRTAALPAEEQFVQSAGLRLRLSMRATELKPFQDPGFTLHFENVGSTTLFVNPIVESNLYIYEASGALVKPTSTWIADCVIVAISRPQLIQLKPGERWSKTVKPSHSPDAVCQGYSYTIAGRPGLALRGGRYTARFVYSNYAGRPVNYDVREIRDIWEGRQESQPVGFSVFPGAEPELDRSQTFDLQTPKGMPASVRPLHLRPRAIGCDERTAAPLLLEDGLPNQSAISDLSTCGDATAFHQLRVLLDSSRAPVRFAAIRALRALTFTTQQFDEVPVRAWPDDWDAWYRTHKGESRAQWAERRLRDAGQRVPSDLENVVAAIDYLASVEETRWREAILDAADAKSYEVRIAAARAIATWDVETGVALLTREVRNRQLAACQAAVSALGDLTGQKIDFDFTIPDERDRAMRTYSGAR